MRTCLIALFMLSSIGCMVSDQKPETIVTRQLKDIPKKFILLGAGSDEGDLTFALMQHGITVKPIQVTQSVFEVESPARMVQYKEAGYRFALKLSINHNYSYVCLFSGGHIVDVTMAVIDVSTNETLAIIKQSGPNQKCPPLTPVWTLLATELADNVICFR